MFAIVAVAALIQQNAHNRTEPFFLGFTIIIQSTVKLKSFFSVSSVVLTKKACMLNAYRHHDWLEKPYMVFAHTRIEPLFSSHKVKFNETMHAQAHIPRMESKSTKKLGKLSSKTSFKIN